MSIRANPVGHTGSLSQVSEFRMALDILSSHDDAIGHVSGDLGMISMAEQGLAANGPKTIGTNDQVGVEIWLTQQVDGGGVEVDADDGVV